MQSKLLSYIRIYSEFEEKVKVYQSLTFEPKITQQAFNVYKFIQNCPQLRADRSLSDEWFQKAFGKGHVSHINIGKMLEGHDGSELDLALALHHYLKANSLCKHSASVLVARVYIRFGEYVKAFETYLEAFLNGGHPTECRLIELYPLYREERPPIDDYILLKIVKSCLYKKLLERAVELMTWVVDKKRPDSIFCYYRIEALTMEKSNPKKRKRAWKRR